MWPLHDGGGGEGKYFFDTLRVVNFLTLRSQEVGDGKRVAMGVQD